MNAMTCEEYTSINPTYVHGVGCLWRLGDNFAAGYFQEIPSYLKDGGVIIERVPALVLVRPLTSLMTCRACKMKEMLAHGGVAAMH